MQNLIEIQSRLKAPKNQKNSFGGYNYRSCEDILEAVKPLLKEYGCSITLSDSIEEYGGRVYVRADAIFQDGKNIIRSTAYAREEETKKGMDAAQITGSASSYARKYALNGLLLIDDTKDPDAIQKAEPEKKKQGYINKRGDTLPDDARFMPIRNEIKNLADKYKWDFDSTLTALNGKYFPDNPLHLIDPNNEALILAASQLIKNIAEGTK